MDWLLTFPPYAIVFLFGSAIGSFLNVVIYRLPAGLSLLSPPSRCPHCLHRLKKHENVPVFGWLWLRGRCSHCGAKIAIRYPLVEAATGLLFLLIFWQFGLTWQTVGYWTLASWLLALSFIDLDTFTLPNSMTQSGLVAGLVFQALWAFHRDFDLARLSSGLMGAIFAAVLGLWLFEIVTFLGSMVLGQTAMGGGDAKLAALIGAWLGWKLLLLTGFLACAIGAFIGGGAIALGLLGRRQPMPFGPFLALAALISAIWGNTLISAYLQLFFPQ